MKKISAIALALLLILSLVFVTACNKNEDDELNSSYLSSVGPKLANSLSYKEPPVKGEAIVILNVEDFGDIKIKLFQNEAPLACENFLTHCNNGYYDNVIFHRVINDFMIQSGDPEGTGWGGESIWGKDFKDEPHIYLKPVRGMLCMANTGSPSSNSSQFFIVQTEEAPWLNNAHTVFGYVFEGMDVVDAIAATPCGGEDNSTPITEVKINSANVILNAVEYTYEDWINNQSANNVNTSSTDTPDNTNDPDITEEKNNAITPSTDPSSDSSAGPAQTSPDDYKNPPVEGEKIVVMTIKDFGDIKIKFFPHEAPLACENFLTHCENGYYNGLKFHRVINDFMIQGGDPLGLGIGGESIWGTPFQDEFSDNLRNVKGMLSMANSGPATNGSQFFIVQAEETPWLNNAHTVFGYVFEGIDVVDAIANTPCNDSIPMNDVIIEKAEVMLYVG